MAPGLTGRSRGYWIARSSRAMTTILPPQAGEDRIREETSSVVKLAVKSAPVRRQAPRQLAKFGLLIAAPGAPPSFGD